MKYLAILFASGFYSGYSPLAPGTFGTLVGSIFIIGGWHLGIFDSYYCLFFITIATILVGYWAVLALPQHWAHDDQKIVIDEIVGIFVTMLFIPITMKTILYSFILFRIFDIWKPLGIRKFDDSNSSFSVILDDILAGIYANLVLRGLMLLLPLI